MPQIPYDRSVKGLLEVLWRHCQGCLTLLSVLCCAAEPPVRWGGEQRPWAEQAGQPAGPGAARQPHCNQNIYRHLGWGAPFILGPSCTPGHGALWILGLLVPPLSFRGINVIWSDIKQDLLLEPLDWNVLLIFFLMMIWNGCSSRWQASCEERSLWHQHFPT